MDFLKWTTLICADFIQFYFHRLLILPLMTSSTATDCHVVVATCNNSCCNFVRVSDSACSTRRRVVRIFGQQLPQVNGQTNKWTKCVNRKIRDLWILCCMSMCLWENINVLVCSNVEAYRLNADDIIKAIFICINALAAIQCTEWLWHEKVLQVAFA